VTSKRSFTDSIDYALHNVASAGYQPGIYRRGNGWRVHLNVGGDTWEDVKDLEEARSWLLGCLKLSNESSTE
jgi:hypothetical protein